jgi:hypothetical protein
MYSGCSALQSIVNFLEGRPILNTILHAGQEKFGRNDMRHPIDKLVSLGAKVNATKKITCLYRKIIVAPNKVDDFVCNASGNKIRIESKENQTYLEFTIKREKVRKLGEFLTNEYNLQQGKIPFITLKAKVTNRLFDLAIQEKQIILDFRKYGFDKASLSDRTIGPSGSLNIVSQGNELLHIG